MTYRKTWFSYVLWLMYSILCVALLLYGGHVWSYYFAGIPYAKSLPDSLATPLEGLSDGALILFGLLIIPATVVLYLIIRRIAELIRKKCAWKKSVITRLECLAVLIIMAGGIFLRIEYAGFDISMAENGRLIESESSAEDDPLYEANMQGMMYYNMAVVTQERSGTAIVCYSVKELYVIFLSIVLSFLGNKIASAIIMQVFLQIIGMILIYAVTRKIAGRIPACTALLYLACSLCCLEMFMLFSPEWFFFDLYMIGMLVVVSFVKGYCANRLNRFVAVAVAAVIGAMIGILAYLDMTAATLMIVMVAVFTGKKQRQEDAPIRNFGGVSVLAVLASLIVSVLVCGLMFGVIYGIRGMDLVRCIGNQLAAVRRLPEDALVIEYPYIRDIYLMGILIIPAAFLVFEFFRGGREQNYMLWILICILVAPTPLTVIGSGRFGMLSLYIWSVMAGLGLQNCIFGGKAKVMQAVIEEINAEAEEVGMNDEPEKIETDEKTEESKMMEVTGQSGEPEKPRYFENPLPLPKKHVKREMDYQYPVEEKDMKYDVEVAENDDFDVQ